MSYWQAACIEVDKDEGVDIYIKGCVNSVSELSDLIDKLVAARDEFALENEIEVFGQCGCGVRATQSYGGFEYCENCI